MRGRSRRDGRLSRRGGGGGGGITELSLSTDTNAVVDVAAARDVRAYFDEVERADELAAKANEDDKEPALGWVQRSKRQSRLLEYLDFDALDACLARARASAAGDEAVLTRIGRLQFGNDIGRFTAKKRIGKPAKPTPEEDAAFRKMATERLSADPAAFKARRLGI